MKTIGENIKLARKKKKITQEQLALRANVSRSLIFKYEKNEVEPSAQVMKRIAISLDVYIDNLLSVNIDDNILESDFDSWVNLFKQLPISEKRILYGPMKRLIRSYESEGLISIPIHLEESIK